MKRSYEKMSSSSSSSSQSGQIKLNVGGTLMITREETLRDSVHFFPNSLMGKMFQEKNQVLLEKDESDQVFLDADPMYFRHILNILRQPLLIDVVPRKIDPEIWSQQLEYWGLLEMVELDENAKRVKPLCEMSMKEISERMRRDTLKDEEVVIKTILEATGYYESGGKNRNTVLHIPIGKCKLPWGKDLGETLKSDVDHYQDLLRSQLKVTDVSIKDSHKKTLTYQFQGETYSITDNKTITISFTVVL